MYNPMSLEGKRIIVTGGGSGIGRVTADMICNLGGHVLILDKNQVGISEALEGCSPQSEGVAVDICDDKEVSRIITASVEDKGRFDGMVHCAGVASVVPLRALTKDGFERVMEVNTTAALTLSKLFAGKKINSGDGASIVFISSVYGVVGSACNVAYASSKAALIGIAKALAIELSSKKIRVNCIAPGFIKTNMADTVEYKFDKTHEELIESLHPLGWGEPEDVANGITFLLSEASRWITGAVINIDGGYTAQ